MKKNMPNIKGERYCLGRLQFDRIGVNQLSKGEAIRIGWMVGNVIAKCGEWVIWWRQG